MTTVRRRKKGAGYRPYRPNRPRAKRSKGLRADGGWFAPSTYRPTSRRNTRSSDGPTWSHRYFASGRSPSTPREKGAVLCCLSFAEMFGETAFMGRNRRFDDRPCTLRI